MDPINQNIAKNLNKIRKEKGLTLNDLAEVSGVSKSMLSEIERGGTNPTILVLWKIADGLKIPLTQLISEETANYTLVRQKQQALLNQDNGYQIFSIFPYYDQHKTEVLEVSIQPKGKLSNSGHRIGVDETTYVLNGEIMLKLGNEQFILHSGDTIRFKGGLPHQYINQTDEPVHFLNILTYS